MHTMNAQSECMHAWRDFLWFKCERGPHKLLCHLGPYLMVLFREMLEILGVGDLAGGSRPLGLCP